MSQDSARNFVFTWKIENFSYCPLLEGERLTSPVFTVDTWKKRKLKLWFYPRGLKKSNYLACYFWTCESKTWGNAVMKSYFTVKGLNAPSIKSKILKTTTSNTHGGDNRLASREEIFRKSMHYLPNDTLTIQHHVRITDREMKTITPNYDLRNENIFNDQLLSSAATYELEGLKKKFNPSQCSVVTHVVVGKKSFVWPIKGIRELGSNNIVSIPVLPVLDDDPSFTLTFHVDEVKDASYSSATFKITRMESDTDNLFVKCKITVPSSKNDIEYIQKGEFLFKKNVKNEVLTFSSQIQKSELQSYLNSNDGVLYLRCEFTYSREGNVRQTGNEDLMPFHCAMPAHTIDDQMMKLYQSGNLSDITFRVENRSFNVHKNILGTRSPVFGAMFESDLKESKTGIVHIIDMDSDTLDRMLIFLYSNKFTVPDSNGAIKLYMAADKYQTMSLKHMCLMFLKSVLSVSNVCSILSLADLYQDDQLMNAAKEFVYTNRNEIFVSENWKTLVETNAKLSASIMLQTFNA